MRPMRTLARAGLTAAAGLLAISPAALAENGWDAKFMGQSDYLTLESGQRATSFFKAQNVGQRTWANSTVSLGTTAPRDRRSAMWDTQAWINYGRPTPLEEASVVPGATGTFEFSVLAPDVGERVTYREHFAPVADIPDGGWMEESWGSVYLDYTVTPRVAPTVRFEAAPERVRRGDAIGVVAEARDDYRMRHVQFLLDGGDVGTVAPGADNRFGVSLASDHIGPGSHILTARAVDHVGNETSVSRTFDVYEASSPQPPAPPQPQRVDADATLKVKLLRRSRVRLIDLVVDAPVGSRVSVRCAPRRRRCGGILIGSTRRQLTRIRRIRGVVLPRGGRLSVQVTRPGEIGAVTRFTVTRRTVRKKRLTLG